MKILLVMFILLMLPVLNLDNLNNDDFNKSLVIGGCYVKIPRLDDIVCKTIKDNYEFFQNPNKHKYGTWKSKNINGNPRNLSVCILNNNIILDHMVELTNIIDECYDKLFDKIKIIHNCIDYNMTKKRQIGINYYGEKTDNSPLGRLGTHTDQSIITIVVADGPGLVAKINNNWIPVDPLDNCLIINYGDILNRMTHGKINALVHRVSRSLENKRQSMAYFYL